MGPSYTIISRSLFLCREGQSAGTSSGHPRRFPSAAGCGFFPLGNLLSLRHSSPKSARAISKKAEWKFVSSERLPCLTATSIGRGRASVLRGVTGRFKTSHSWALQNQPRFLVVSDTLLTLTGSVRLFKVSDVGRLSFSSRDWPPLTRGSAPLRASVAGPQDGSDRSPPGELSGAGGRFGWF